MYENYELSETNINEADLLNTIDKYINKLGFKIHKTEGLMQQIKKFSSVAGKMLFYAIKNDKEEVKKLSQQITKGDFIKFIINLDMVTLHLLSGPIHFIAAITGWELDACTKEMPNVKSIVNKTLDAINTLKQNITSLITGKKKEKVLSYVHNIEKNIPVEKKG